MIDFGNTICALSTPQGSGAIGLIRLSGENALKIANKIFEGKDLESVATQSLHFGKIIDGEEIVDEVLVSVFKAPNSYTGENVVEISAHGSSYILSKILSLLIQTGARMAKAGEFTQRAYLNGKMDLVQAEAVTDLIASETKAAHDLAINQMRGGFSNKINALREELIHFASLIELELDFSEEDVEFADRKDLKDLVDKILKIIHQLVASFSTGNVLKNGIPVAILGQPNVGKSTLLNLLLNEDKAIVSDIAGTTRDSIEDTVNIEGIAFRFIDTAGLRDTEDVVENIGIERSYQKAEKASLILYMIDASKDSVEDINNHLEALKTRLGSKKQILVLANKIDQNAGGSNSEGYPIEEETIYISALKAEGIDTLLQKLQSIAKEKMQFQNEVIVSNIRHQEALKKAAESLERVEEGLNTNITGDFLAMDIRQALHHLGEITGSIEVDRDILGNIFSRFCIGK